MIDEKYKLFLKNAQLLFYEFGIKPLLYGSLGLEVLLQKDLLSDDIDILIPNSVLYDNWEYFKTFLESNGYILIDLHEHTFVKDSVKYSYACIEGLNDFAGIDSLYENDYYLSMTLYDFLKVYEASLKDGYRQDKKNKKDNEKIEIIKSAIQEATDN